jgi:hypothetical protein
MIETRLLRPVLLAGLLGAALGSTSGRAEPGFSKGPSEELSQPLPKRPPPSSDHDAPAAGAGAGAGMMPRARSAAPPAAASDAQVPETGTPRP